MSLSVLLFSFSPIKVVFFFVHSLCAFDSAIDFYPLSVYTVNKKDGFPVVRAVAPIVSI